MATSSIHIEPIMGHSEGHNGRLIVLGYVRVEKTVENEIWINQTVAEVTTEAKKIVKEKTGRTMQEKAHPIREGVVVLEGHHTIEDLKNLGKVLEAKFGVRTFQAYIHRDEGHYDKNQKWKQNLHGHMVFDWVNHATGKSVMLKRKDMKEFQTVVAETLGMERGVSSEKKHLNSIQYKIKAQQDQYNEIQKEISEIEAKLEKYKNAMPSRNKVESEAILGLYKQSTIDKLFGLLEVKNEALNRAENKITQLQNQIKHLPTISLEEYEREKKRWADKEKELQAHKDFLASKDVKLVEQNGDFKRVKISEEIAQKNLESKKRMEDYAIEQQKKAALRSGYKGPKI
jgi:hypothetical protein